MKASRLRTMMKKPRLLPHALCLLGLFLVFGVRANAGPATCQGMDLGNLAPLNGFLPFSGDPGNAWNTDIRNAPLDPNSAAIIAGVPSAYKLHPSFGPGGGIPYTIVDSSITPAVAMVGSVAGPPGHNSSESDGVVEPAPPDALIESNQPDCYLWPNYYYVGDTHMLIVDRKGCWLYETYQTDRCDGVYAVTQESLFDLQNYNQRPWGWTSSDAAGLPVFPGLVKYDEATNGLPNPILPTAAGWIRHAFRFTLSNTKGDNNGGYFVLPASHGASGGSNFKYLNAEGMRWRLKSDAATMAKVATYSPINQSILTAMQQYGLILADNGGNMYIIGTPDERWNATDLGYWHGGTPTCATCYILPSDFEVVQASPEAADTQTEDITSSKNYPAAALWTYMDSNSAPYTVEDVENGTYPGGTGPGGTALSPLASTSQGVPGGASYPTIGEGTAGPTPIINSFTANGNSSGAITVAAGTPVTFAMSVSNDGYDYIDNAGPVRLVKDGGGPGISTGSLTLTPAASQTYTLNSVNANGISQTGQAYASSTVYTPPTPNAPPSITVTVAGSELPAPALAPQGGGAITYTTVQHVVVTLPGYPQAVFYYTVDQTIPTYPPTGTTQLYTGPITIANSNVSTACGPAGSVQCNYLKGEAVNVIAYVPGIGVSQVGGAMYIVNSLATAPTFSPLAGTFTSSQTVTISAPEKGIDYSQSGSTPKIFYTTDGTTPAVTTNPDGSLVKVNGAYVLLGTTVQYSKAITVSATTTLEAIAAGVHGYSTSAAATSVYTLPQLFSLSLSQPTITIGPGQTGSFSTIVTATAQNGFNTPISFTCSGMPSGYQCTFAPSSVTPTASGATTSLSVIVSGKTANARHSNPLIPGATLAVALCFFGLRKRRRLQMLLLLAVSIMGVGLFTGCGGSTPAFSGTPTTSTVTVTGTAGAAQSTTTLSLVTFETN